MAQMTEEDDGRTDATTRSMPRQGWMRRQVRRQTPVGRFGGPQKKQQKQMWTSIHPQRSWLDRGHRRLGKRLRDDPIQGHAEGTGRNKIWQAVASDRAQWAVFESGFIKGVLRKRGPAKELAPGRM